MAARRGFSGKFSRSARNPPVALEKYHAPPPAIAPVPVESTASSFGGAFVMGLALVTGLVVAHRLVDGILGPRTIKVQTVHSSSSSPTSASSKGGSDECGVHSQAYENCMQNSYGDYSKCQLYQDLLNNCKKKKSG